MKDETPKNFKINSNQWWCKVLGMLSQNWALVEINIKTKGATIYFFYDQGLILGGGGPSMPIKFYKTELLEYACIIDSLEFNSVREAELGLKRNMFKMVKYPRAADSYEPEPPHQSKFFDARKFHKGIYLNSEYWIK